MLTRALIFVPLTLFLSTLSVAAPTPQPWYEKYHQPRVAVPQTYYEAVSLRRQTPIARNVVQDVVCLDSNVYVLNSHPLPLPAKALPIQSELQTNFVS
jgi:hypothetical protein